MPAPCQSDDRTLVNAHIVPEDYDRLGLYQAHLLEQYRLYVQTVEQVSNWRMTTNGFFLTLNAVVLSTSTFAYEKGPALPHKALVLIPLAALLTLCYTWHRLVQSYRQLNRAKFKVIDQFEQRLPASPFWQAEWKALASGKDPKVYRPISGLEKWVPALFSFLYVCGAVFVIFF